MPFENLTGDEDLAYLADGVADELIATLTRSSGLTIRTRNHSFGYRDYDGDLAAIASELDARYLFVGSVRKSGEILRLTSQLVDPQSGANLWTATEEHNIRGTFDGQDRLSRGAAMALADITGRDNRSCTSIGSISPTARSVRSVSACTTNLAPARVGSVATGD